MTRTPVLGAKVAILSGLLILVGWQLVGRGAPSDIGDRMVPLAVGDRVPAVRVFDLRSSDSANLADLVHPGCHIVYVFDPTCPACQAGVTDWNDVETSPLASQRIIWLSIGTTEDSSRVFLRDADIRFPAYYLSPAARPLGIGSIPGVWGVTDGVISFRQAGRSATSPTALAAAFGERGGWCQTD